MSFSFKNSQVLAQVTFGMFSLFGFSAHFEHTSALALLEKKIEIEIVKNKKKKLDDSIVCVIVREYDYWNEKEVTPSVGEKNKKKKAFLKVRREKLF